MHPASRQRSSAAIAAIAAVLLAAALALASVVIGPAGAASADDTEGIAGGPSAGVGPDGRTAFLYLIDPGQVLEDGYYVKNTGTVAQTVTVFATDAYTTDDGSYALLDTDETPSDAGSWVTFDGGQPRMSVELAPGETRVLAFTVTVPADATPGDHAGGIVVATTAASGQVLVERRVATRMYVRVDGDLQAALTVANIETSYVPEFNPFTGVATITVTYRNTGNIAVGGDVAVGVTALFGIPVGQPITEHLLQLLPGTARTVTYSVTGVPQAGLLFAQVSATPTVTSDLPIPAFESGEVRRDAVLLAVPWWIVILVVLGAIVWLVRRWRRRVDERRAAEWMAWTEAEAERKAAQITASAPPRDDV